MQLYYAATDVEFSTLKSPALVILHIYLAADIFKHSNSAIFAHKKGL